jgi:hypothetical protein
MVVMWIVSGRESPGQMTLPRAISACDQLYPYRGASGVRRIDEKTVSEILAENPFESPGFAELCFCGVPEKRVNCECRRMTRR